MDESHFESGFYDIKFIPITACFYNELSIYCFENNILIYRTTEFYGYINPNANRELYYPDCLLHDIHPRIDVLDES